MTPPSRLALRLLAVVGLIVAAGPLQAQDWMQPKAGDGRARAWEGSRAPTSGKPLDADVGAEAQRRTDARHRAWDRKMKATTGSVCTGC